MFLNINITAIEGRLKRCIAYLLASKSSEKLGFDNKKNEELVFQNILLYNLLGRN